MNQSTKTWRESERLSQRQAAYLCEVSIASWQLWETNPDKAKPQTMDKLQARMVELSRFIAHKTPLQIMQITELTAKEAAKRALTTLAQWERWKSGEEPTPNCLLVFFHEKPAGEAPPKLVHPLQKYMVPGLDCYTVDDPFGQKRIAHLRNPGNSRPKPPQVFKTGEDLSADGMSSEEFNEAMRMIKQGVEEEKRHDKAVANTPL